MATIQGTPVDWFVQDHLQVQVALSKDTDAEGTNLGKKAPQMFKDVRAGRAVFPFAFAVDRGSALEFTIKYRGRWGFGYRIVTGTNTIVNALFYCSETEYSDAATTVRRYQGTARAIQAQDWSTLNADTKEKGAAEWQLDITAWEVKGFVRDGRRFGTPAQPGVVGAGAIRSGVEKEAAAPVSMGAGLTLGAGASIGASVGSSVAVKGGGLTSGQLTSAGFDHVTRLNHDGPGSSTRGYLRILVFVND